VFAAAVLRSQTSRTVQLKVNTMWEVCHLSEQYRNFVLEIHASGVLQAKEADLLLHPLAAVMAELNKDRRRIKRALQKEASRRRKLSKLDAVLMIQRSFLNGGRGRY